MLCYKEEFLVEMRRLDCAIAKLEVISLHSFRCYRHGRFQSLTPL